MRYKGIQIKTMALVGTKTGHLTVKKVFQKELNNGKKFTFLLCECECGKSKEITLGSFKKNKFGFIDCSCKKNYTHGHTTGHRRTPEYRTWGSIKERCYNKNNAKYRRYGGRGISVCPEWIESFESFFAFMGKRPSNKHSIDRINNDGNYEPGNVRWATIKQQSENNDRTIKLLWQGKIMTISELAEMSGVYGRNIRKKLSKGHSLEKALTLTNCEKMWRNKKSNNLLAPKSV